MSVRTQSRRLTRPVTALINPHSHTFILPIRSVTQIRSASSGSKATPKTKTDTQPTNKSTTDTNRFTNPYLEAYERSKAEDKNIDLSRDSMPSSPASFLPQGSVWDAEFRPPKAQYLVDPDISPEEQLRGTVKYEQIQPPSDNTDSIPVPIEIKDRRWSNMALKLDPRPLKRQLYQRKRITRAVQSKWSMTRKEILNMTERKVVQRSANLSTSTKKLMLLARQVAGKTLEEAEAQMRFSKKRYALSLRLLLEQVRNRAVIESGMGLGTDLPKGQEKHIVLKDGRKHKVKNETGLYLDQAWVEKGQHMKDVEFRAKGKVNRILHRQSRVVLQLKEEKTRIREHNEREAKRAQRKPWTQLPDRPVTFQHQHCLW